ncbi:carbon-nitrogen family hydrolase [Staphylospora marina]|uniref:carbon-nitrogen family hydrolase n=1 Tax=Staphylospora marina TaxID=2490858 RepID=UPI000F5BBD38|nr:carbon-nitrogen family hydrolase [Staphylospora marina]
MKWKIALAQMDLSFGQPEENFAKAEGFIRRAASEGADVVVLPELWNTGYDLTRILDIADPDSARTEAFIRKLATELNIHIVAGSVAALRGNRPFNTLLAVDKTGQLAGTYSKVHLFRLMDEEKYLTPGDHPGLFRLDDVPCAAAICYDIRFPEWIRRYALEGARVLFVPAEWPEPRLRHWRTLLTARAIENQCYVVACNRSGSDPANTFAGHSMIIDPWGEVIVEAGDAETLAFGSIDTDLVAEVRSRIPVFEDRRPELYGRR